MQGCGNDFILIDNLSQQLELSTEQVAFLCDRRFGVGADGLIMVRPAEDLASDVFMHFLNADGSLPGICGNALLCLAKYIIELKYIEYNRHDMVIGTLTGPKPLSYSLDESGMFATATVDMGVPRWIVADSQMKNDSGFAPGLSIVTKYGSLAFTLVDMGNPHAVVLLDEAQSDILDLPVEEFATLAGQLARHPSFPEIPNLEFAWLLDPAAEPDGAGIKMRVFERGVGETLACGTGACATVVATATTQPIRVRMPGGCLDISWADDGHILMTGTATTVYQGSIELM